MPDSDRVIDALINSAAFFKKRHGHYPKYIAVMDDEWRSVCWALENVVVLPKQRARLRALRMKLIEEYEVRHQLETNGAKGN